MSHLYVIYITLTFEANGLSISLYCIGPTLLLKVLIIIYLISDEGVCYSRTMPLNPRQHFPEKKSKIFKAADDNIHQRVEVEECTMLAWLKGRWSYGATSGGVYDRTDRVSTNHI